MKVSREQAQANRERVVEVAARLYRERGFDGVGVADIMKTAGLTHGGFYGQFAGKEELMAEAAGRALADVAAIWQQLAARQPDDGFGAVLDAYLSPAHRDHPGAGCTVAALGADCARHPGTVRTALTAGVRTLLDRLTALLPGRSAAARREKALSAYCTMIGALVLARAVDDPAFSDEILTVAGAAVRKTAG